jgi:tryptophan 2,3-dioxygenase
MTDTHDRQNDRLIEPTATMVTYDSYLKVSQLTSLQNTLSVPAQHDETLFIIIHQVYELWFKQILHEVSHGIEALRADKLLPFLRSIKRITTIQNVLVKQIDILETMTPTDFNRFRERLNPASGFQSWQFRIVEFLLGAKDSGYLRFFKATPELQAKLESALAQPTLYDHFLQHLSRRGLKIPKSVLERDYRQIHEPSEEIKRTFFEIYQDTDRNYDLYMTLEAMLDLDEQFTLWRYRHIAMVERMIGNRMGTGGSSGVDYLTKTLRKRFFPEIWQLRNDFGASWGSRT